MGSIDHDNAASYYPQSNAECLALVLFGKLDRADKRLIAESGGTGLAKFPGSTWGNPKEGGEWRVETDESDIHRGARFIFERNGRTLVITHTVVPNEEGHEKGSPSERHIYTASLDRQKIALEDDRAIPRDTMKLMEEASNLIKENVLNRCVDNILAENFNTPAANLIRNSRAHAQKALSAGTDSHLKA